MAKLAAGVYARALFETAQKDGGADIFYEEVKALLDIFREETGLLKLLSSPKLGREEKLSVLSEIFGGRIEERLMGFLRIMVEKERQGELREAMERYIDMVREEKKIGVAFVRSALELDESQKAAIEGRLLETTGYNRLEMNFSVDESLLGGLVIRINNRVVDSSIRSRLSGCKAELLSLRAI